ncbi:bifunctional hydroxymethylpyrimidine kinase/phosphomethylpyrimidine kinase [Treponema sp.]|uniref:bifunctional hydroxymethylpyrimidine kinase/phosphomethylpyrimidine kinase n=1 Tax=Treponema sp. TaxID=166 RepID=UPI003FA22F16
MIKLATIAGSDASGGAGLEADLKTFQEYGGYGMAAVTLIATMNPHKDWSHEVFPLTEEALRAQLETIFTGIGVDAAKTGMLATPYAIELSAEYISKYKVQNYVLDPVMICKGGNLPLNPELNALLVKKLLPLAKIITPNVFEAGQIAQVETPSSLEEIKEAAKRIYDLGVPNVFIKGGSKLKDQTASIDVFYDGSDFRYLEAELIKTEWTHGCGCTVAAAITAGLGFGLDAYEATLRAKKFITLSLRNSFALNQWVGPGNPAAWRKAFN